MKIESKKNFLGPNMDLAPLINHILLKEKPRKFEEVDKQMGIIELTKGMKYPEWVNKAMFVDKAYGDKKRKFFLVFHQSKSSNPNHFILHQGCLIGDEFYTTFRGSINKKSPEDLSVDRIIRKLSKDHKILWC